MSSAEHRSRSRRELVADVIGVSARQQEQKLLLELLELELVAAQVYSLAAASPALSPGGVALVQEFSRQEQAHAAALAPLAGQDPSAAPPSTAVIQTMLAAHGFTVSLAALRTEHAWFAALERMEGALEGAYYRALGRLFVRPDHATLLARILASEAQHSTQLFSYRHPDKIILEVGKGFVTGNAPQPPIASAG